MDRLLRAEIVSEVQEALLAVHEMYEERWLTAERLSEEMGMFSPAWLKRYGHLLPRERAEVVDGAEMHATRWAYPLHKIQRLLAERKLKELKIH